MLPIFADPFPVASVLLAAGREESLRPLLVQLVVIILAARAGAVVARWLRQPSVVGEIVAGLKPGRQDDRERILAINLGIAMVPEDRKLQGLLLGFSVEQNISLAVLARLAKS
ncbi:MAG: hypothetical protein WCO99_11300, partial [Planctomycetota bacterium]